MQQGKIQLAHGTVDIAGVTAGERNDTCRVRYSWQKPHGTVLLAGVRAGERIAKQPPSSAPPPIYLYIAP